MEPVTDKNGICTIFQGVFVENLHEFPLLGSAKNSTQTLRPHQVTVMRLVNLAIEMRDVKFGYAPQSRRPTRPVLMSAISVLIYSRHLVLDCPVTTVATFHG